jgi:predicted RNase H-like nuclease (RuvC/YqgF family)
LDLNETHIGELRSEISHLRTLLECKSTEIKRLLEENENMKKTMTAEIELQTKANEELRVRMKALERDGLENVEALKIKMAQLVDADMKSLVVYYQSELSLLQTNVNEL